jgi:hypothetical protein
MRTLAAAADLDLVLDRVAHAIARHGTASRRPLLERLAAEAAWVSPGAAAALVDWGGAEVARLRAYGVLHARVAALGADERARLLVGLRREAPLPLAG